MSDKLTIPTNGLPVFEVRRKCPRCREVKSVAAFFDGAKSTTPLPCCASCHFRERIAQPGRALAVHHHRHWYNSRKKKYKGLTEPEFAALYRAQGSRCAVCRKLLYLVDAKRDTACIDHCKAARLTRGLLCADCNVGIGFLGHDPERLAAAAAYMLVWLAKHAGADLAVPAAGPEAAAAVEFLRGQLGLDAAAD